MTPWPSRIDGWRITANTRLNTNVTSRAAFRGCGSESQSRLSPSSPSSTCPTPRASAAPPTRPAPWLRDPRPMRPWCFASATSSALTSADLGSCRARCIPASLWCACFSYFRGQRRRGVIGKQGLQALAVAEVLFCSVCAQNEEAAAELEVRMESHLECFDATANLRRGTQGVSVRETGTITAAGRSSSTLPSAFGWPRRRSCSRTMCSYCSHKKGRR